MTATVTVPPVMRRAVLIGLVGEGVAPSLTPPMHELEGARHGMHYVYRPIDLARGEGTRSYIVGLLDWARRLGFDGLNVTHPLKQAVVPLLDDLAPSARTVGAVNTVLFAPQGTVGHNTDVTGFGAAFDAAFADAPRGRVLLVGAGGAGSAVASALAARDIEDLVVIDADPDRAATLAAGVAAPTGRRVRAAGLDQLSELIRTADGVINATPVGMAAHPGAPFDVELLHEDIYVADIVYRPVETTLLRAARARGCRVMSGLGMAMHQAADAFELFTGEPADRSAMLADLQNLVTAEAASTHAEEATPRGRIQ